jgi:regulator of protease activity HflC (stomatin/prohibitin superfamily)
MAISSILIALLIITAFLSFVTVQQGTIAVVTIFGKYRRIMGPGLNFKIPFIEQVYKRVSIQNRSVELEFQAITVDQANVYFKAMLLYAVVNTNEESIKNVAFKFIDDRNLMQALVRTIEGSIRGFVATKKTSGSTFFKKRNSRRCERADRPNLRNMGLSFIGFTVK